MIFESFSRPKARDFSVPADDVLLHLPGRISGVFDGASDSLGRTIDGVPVGRMAALAAARATMELPAAAIDWPVTDILGRLSAAVGSATQSLNSEGSASTTALIAIEGLDTIRLVGIGDTGFRLNGGPVQITELAPDRVSIPARVALFRHLLAQGETPAACETVTRRCMGAGFASAVAEGFMPQTVADQITHDVLARLPSPNVADDARRLLQDGLQSQFRFANAPETDLAYGVLNGSAPRHRDAMDVRLPRQDCNTIEIFSDGYLMAPQQVSIAAWEEAHAEIERKDPHKISQTPAIKGSDERQVFDDRTVAILRFAQP